MRARRILLTVILSCALSGVANSTERDVLRSRVLEVRLDRLAEVRVGDTMSLKLFADASYDAVIEDRTFAPDRGLVLHGRLLGLPYSWLTMVEKQGVLAGVVVTGQRVYRVRYSALGLHTLDEIDPLSLRWEADDAAVPELDAALPSVGEPLLASETNAKTQIDILVVYTKAAARQLTKSDYFWIDEGNAKKAMESQAELAVQIMNAALKNSKIKAEARLVGVKQISGKGSGSMDRDLIAVTDPSDGKFDQAHVLREQLGADFVVLAIQKDKEKRGGIGWVVPAQHSLASTRAFSVVLSDQLWWITLAHEIGHNMGLVHDPDNDTTPSQSRSFPYSRGYRNEAKGLATLMAYTRGCDACWLSIPHYSHKKVRWKGMSQPSDPELVQPGCKGEEPFFLDASFPQCGTRTGSGKFFAAKSINRTRNIFAAFRACRVDCE